MLNQLSPNFKKRSRPGTDGIPPDLIKHYKDTLQQPLHDVLCQCSREGAMQQDMRDAKIVTFYKNKGDRSHCNNYRGISLLSFVGKLYVRLQKLAERVHPESQCGFRAERSTVDRIFSLQQLQEKCREQHKPLYIAFIYLTKALDLVSREGLFNILPKIGFPQSSTASSDPMGQYLAQSFLGFFVPQQKRQKGL